MFDNLITIVNDVFEFIINKNLDNNNKSIFNMTSEQFDKFKQILINDEYKLVIEYRYYKSTKFKRIYIIINKNYIIGLCGYKLMLLYKLNNFIYRFNHKYCIEFIPISDLNYIDISYKLKNNKILDVIEDEECLNNLNLVVINYLTNDAF